MRLDLTQRVHLDMGVSLDRPVWWDVHVSSYVESVWPFRGFWLSFWLSLGPVTVRVYCGE